MDPDSFSKTGGSTPGPSPLGLEETQNVGVGRTQGDQIDLVLLSRVRKLRAARGPLERVTEPSSPPGLLLLSAASREMQGTQKMASLIQLITNVLISAFRGHLQAAVTLPEGLGRAWLREGHVPLLVPPWAEVAGECSGWVCTRHWAQRPPSSVWRVGVEGGCGDELKQGKPLLCFLVYV